MISRENTTSSGIRGRFGAGLPRVNDGSLLFLQHMVHKFEPVRPDEHKHGSRLAIVFSGSPLFTGGAGSGESDIRKWIIEKTTGSKPSSPCQSRCSTTPASAPTSGSSPTARRSAGRAKFSFSTPVTCGPRAGVKTTSAVLATSAATSPQSRLRRSCSYTAALRTASAPSSSTTMTSATHA